MEIDLPQRADTADNRKHEASRTKRKSANQSEPEQAKIVEKKRAGPRCNRGRRASRIPS